VKAAEDAQGSGRLTVDLHATGPLKNASALTLSGRGTVHDVQLRLVSLTTPLAIEAADLRFTRNSGVLENMRGRLGTMNATGSVTLQNFASPRIEFVLAADRLNLNELPSWFRARAPAASGNGEGLLSRAVGHGKATLRTVLYDQLVLENVKSDASLDHGVIRLDPLVADVYGGSQTGSIVIDTRPAPIQYAVRTRMERVDADKLISSTTSLKEILYGVLMANADASFRQAGPSDQIARSLSGKLAVDLREGRIANLDLGYEIANIGRFLTTGKAMRPFTNVVSLTGHFDVQQGVARTNDLKLVIDGATVAATGAANLADESLDLRLVAALSKEHSAEVGGTHVGGYMMTALADENGHLVVPLTIGGTFTHPRVVPDLQRVATMKVQQTLSDPARTLTGLVGRIAGERLKQRALQTQPEAEPEEAAPATPTPRPTPSGTLDLLQQLLDAARKPKSESAP
jgi:uncharacterized protein YhdP